MPKNKTFLKMFGNGQTNTHATQPSQTDPESQGPTPRTDSKESSFFDFDSRPAPGSPFQSYDISNGSGDITGWGSDLSYNPNLVSPPQSSTFSPKDWNGDFQYIPQTQSQPLHTQSDGARTQYGQVTPPDDDNVDESVLDYELRAQLQTPTAEQRGDSTRKRKRNGNETANPTSAKRSRKYASRANPSSPMDPNNPTEQRRSKFLERNRVAASKCRQKKKEWTQNLESRGRELQKHNSNMRMMVDSLRQEVLFLKGEMLKHTGCGCTLIHDFLKNGAQTLPESALHGGRQDGAGTLKREELSPFGSMPSSRVGSVAMTDERDAVSQAANGDDFDENEASEKARAGNEDALQALLTSSISHDTSNEGIKSRLEG